MTPIRIIANALSERPCGDGDVDGAQRVLDALAEAGYTLVLEKPLPTSEDRCPTCKRIRGYFLETCSDAWHVQTNDFAFVDTDPELREAIEVMNGNWTTMITVPLDENGRTPWGDKAYEGWLGDGGKIGK